MTVIRFSRRQSLTSSYVRRMLLKKILSVEVLVEENAIRQLLDENTQKSKITVRCQVLRLTGLPKSS